ncbi:MAG: peptidylprolyl isomerase [Thermoanaerobaculia bacterium]
MLKTILPRLTLLLGLALLTSGLAGCKSGPEKDAASDNIAPAAAATPAAPGAAAPGAPAAAPGAEGQTPFPSLPSQPGQAAGEAPMPAEKIPEVVANVNGVEIHKKDLLQASQVVEMRLAQMGRRTAPTPRFYREVLNELVAITLLQQDARAQGVKASDQEIQQALSSRKSQFPSEDAYKKALAQAGVTETALRKQAGDQIAVQKYVQTRIVPKVAVSDQAAREFYDKNQAEMQMPERLHLRHILIRTNPGGTPADKEAARKKADDLLKRIQGGEDFAKLAQENSDDPESKVRGGELGLVPRGRTPPPFDAAAAALKNPNDLSPVVETQFGFHIIQLLERAPASTVPFEQVKERILLGLKQQQAQKMVQARADELRKQGKVQIFI